jgi:hypothetical protein
MTRTRDSKVFYFCAATILGVFGYFGWKLMSRTAYESAAYRVLDSDGAFETREYSELTLVTTLTQSDSSGDDGGFMRLFRYISGANANQQKVAMTTPVFMKSKADDGLGQMSFVIPSEIADSNVPVPTSNNVHIGRRSGGRFAVFRFAGRLNEKALANAEQKLRSWVKRNGLNGHGVAELAGYDPPWTPGSFRRNEILIRIK